MRTISKKAVIMLVVIMTVAIHSAYGQQWVLLGKKTVNYAVDNDVMPVTLTTNFKAIKILVTKAPLNMHRCVVHFGNGSSQEVQLKHNFAPGSDSRIIDLEGGDRFITSISFWYDTKNFAKKKAIVSVFGRL